MKYDKVEVDYDNNKESAYRFSEHLAFADGSLNVYFLITESALKEYSQNYTTTALQKFSKKYLKKFVTYVNKAMVTFLKQYKGSFPLYSCETIDLIFADLPKDYAYMVANPDDPTHFIITYSIRMLNLSKKDILFNIAHEIYHIVEAVHESVDDWDEKIMETRKTLSKKIKLNRELLMDKLNEIRHIFTLRNNAKIKFERMRVLIDEFYATADTYFNSRICDAGLGIIAISLNDTRYIKQGNIEDLGYVDDFKCNLQKINRLFDQSCLKTSKRLHPRLIAMKNVIQFINCSVNYPIFSVAYTVLQMSRKWEKDHPYAKLKKRSQSHRNLSDFYRYMKEYCAEEVFEGVMKFTQQFEKTIEYQAIHANPDIAEELTTIHNEKSIESAVLSYRILHRELDLLLEKLQNAA